MKNGKHIFNKLKRHWRAAACSLVFATYITPAHAQSSAGQSPWQFKGYATVNYEVSDSRTAYDTQIDRNGTLIASSILGFQASYAFTPKTSFVTQMALSRRNQEDNKLEASLRWAYLSHRYDNGVQVRLGRQRLNLYRNSENLEIGSTYTMANLPDEVYINTDYLSGDGISVRQHKPLGDSYAFEWGLIAANRSLDLSDSARTQLQTNERSGDIKLLNAYTEFAWSLNSSVFASYLHFSGDVANSIGRADSEGSILSLTLSHRIEDTSITLEHTRVAVDTNFIFNAAGQINISDSHTRGYAITLEHDMQQYRPYINYGRYLQSDSTKLGLWSARAGLAYRYDVDTTLKFEAKHISASGNPSNVFFDAPIGSKQKANVVTLSYNRLF